MPDASRLPLALEQLLCAYCAGAMPAGVALMQLSMAASNAEELTTALDMHLSRHVEDGDPSTAHRIDELNALISSSPDAWQTVRDVAAMLTHEPAQHENPEAAVRHIAAAFDRAVSISPEGSVALYSLGRRDLLEEATSEVVEFMRSLDLVGHDRVLLDIGCGIGRFELALASRAGRIDGVDVSAGMLDLARRRCAGHQNVSFHLCRGARLPPFTPASFDCIFAVDSFPYIVQADPKLPRLYLEESEHLLKPGGDLLILNFSYRSDPGADARDVENLACLNRLEPLRVGERPFQVWDGRVFHLRKAHRRLA
ncbi:MAG: methyltransferase domain-containing protein [Hyphomicrobiales bacterium]|nr:methyltransferase domain-containing protein [Hyphomicrobiales bacterium]